MTVLAGEDRGNGIAAASAPWQTPRQFRIQADGHDLQAEWRGPRPDQAPTLVFLHDGLGSIGQWRDFPAVLGEATGFGVLCYDRWGYGASEPLAPPYRRPIDFLHREGLHILAAVLDATDIRRAILVGHSDGGTIALLAASRVDSRISAVITEAAHVFLEDETIAAIRDLVDRWRDGDLRERLTPHHGANVEGAFLGWSGAWLDPDFESFTIESYLAAITCPVLAIQGDRDRFGTHRQLDTIRHGVWACKDALSLPGCGHTPHHQARAESLAAMVGFINETIA